MIRLNMYGWNDRLNQLKQESAYNTLSHGRIAIVHRTRATAPKFLLKYVLWHKSLKYFKKSCVIGE